MADWINTWLNPIGVLITIFLFILYLIGKVVTSTRESGYYTEVLTFNPNEKILDNLIIIDEYNDDSNERVILLHSKEVLYNVKLIELNCENLNSKKQSGKVVKNIKKLFPNEGFIVKTYFPCGIPKYAITWDKYNYMKAVFLIAENGKTGFRDFEKISYSNSIRSYIYNFIK